MKKTVYSLVLNEEVVRQVDRLAYEKGTSRSNLINQILAQSVGLLTDERRMDEIFQHACQMLADYPALQASRASETVMTVRSALNYKYNPSMRYSITVENRGGRAEGCVKASLRSQNRELVHHLRRFFTLWSRIEQAYGKEPRFSLDGARFSREFTIPPRMEDDRRRQARMVVAYVAAMNSAFNGYFGHADDMTGAVKEIERVYLEYLKAQPDLL